MLIAAKSTPSSLAGAIIVCIAWCSNAVIAQELCDSMNLLGDTTFATASDPERKNVWGGLEHSTPGSFDVASADGVLTITKVGEEPWFIYRQRVSAKELGGKTVRYSAELRFDTDAPNADSKVQHGAGMFFEVRNRSRRKVKGSVMEHEPNYGETDWVPIALEFKLPGNVLDVSAGFIHQANGSLQVRNPSLVAVKAQPCADEDAAD